MTRKNLAILMTVAVASTAPCLAQQSRPLSSSTQRFEAAAPKIGEAMPDLTLYDDQGHPLRLREVLRDHYTVVVASCLT